MTASSQDLASILELYTQGLYLQAYERAEALGPLREWTGTEARVLAGRLAHNLGAGDLGRWHHFQALRGDRTHPEARYYYTRAVLERHGPLAAWERMVPYPELPGATPEQQSDWFALRGHLAAVFRDFDTAEHWLARAEVLAPESPWLWIERCEAFEFEDRYAESLAAAQRSLELRPWFRPGVQAAAQALQLLDRDAEARALLEEAAERLESGGLLWQLTLLQREYGDYRAMGETLDRLERMLPLAEADLRKWTAQMRSEVAYHQGDVPSAIRLAREGEDGFFTKLADRMEAATDTRRVLLPVGFVRQHHVTCAPATLAALTRFWSQPAEHLAVAEEICYDGTPHYNERRWAEESGWAAREFTVTWESSVALLDRGVPFTLTTVGTGSAHLQAVVGYDACRGTLLIRDPYHRYLGEGAADGLLEDQRPYGPRGMALVPSEQAAVLEGLDLPDAALYDRMHALQLALQRHDRETARIQLEALQWAAPEHLLTLNAARTLALYDGDLSGALACVERLLEQFSEEANLRLSRVGMLGELGRREERLALLREYGTGEEPEPVFWRFEAQELLGDNRELEKAQNLLRRALRKAPTDGATLFAAAHLAWTRRDRGRALQLYRFASCLDDRDEHLANAYFAASRYLKQSEAALALLQDRFARFGTRSGHPAKTLFTALADVDRTPAAFAVLDEALRRRPEDGDLILFAADAHARYGRLERAAELLESAEGKVRRPDLLSARAAHASYRGDGPAALALWREVLQEEPLNLEAHAAVARLLAETEGTDAVNAHFRAATERFPHHFRLHVLWESRLRDQDPAGAETVLRRMLEINPADAWARRELAWVLGRQRRLPEAWHEAGVAAEIDPDDPALHTIQGQLHSWVGDWPAAREAYREAIRLSADDAFAIEHLTEACDTPAERRAALAFIQSELARQTVGGDGLVAFRDAARGALEAEELLTALQDALRERPDLWHAWSVCIHQLVDMDRLDKALELAGRAAERFPLAPAAWLDLAVVHAARLDRKSEQQALEQAAEISPGWSPALRQLFRSYKLTGEPEKARRALEQAVVRDPLDPVNQAYLAQVQWDAGEREAALERVRWVLHVAPSYEWAWEALKNWCAETNRPEEPVCLARDLTHRRPGDVTSWMALARVLSRPSDLEERLRALDRAVELDARCFEAYDLRAETLAEAGRFDEALAACRPPVGEVPTNLLGRAAWVHAAKGDQDAAVRAMREAVESDPGYHWGWLQLARWHDERGETDQYLEAARHLVQLGPQDAGGHGLLGDAQIQSGDRATGKASLQHAMELDPDYRFAGFALLDAQIEDNELGEAARTMDRLLAHKRDEWALSRAVGLACKRGDQSGAAAYLGELCVCEGENSGTLHSAARSLEEAGWWEAAEAVYSRALEQPGGRPQVGELWVRCRLNAGDTALDLRLAEMRVAGEAGFYATSAYVDALVESGNAQQFHWLVEKYREALYANNQTWASVGWGYLVFGRADEVIRWQENWANRVGVEPWMVLHLVTALRRQRREGAAAAVSREMAADAARGGAWHAVWLALDAGLAGNRDEAARWLGLIEPGDLDPYYGLLFGMAFALHLVQSADADGRPAAFASARAMLGQARKPYGRLSGDALIARLWRAATARIASDAGTPFAAIWRVVEWLRPL